MSQTSLAKLQNQVIALEKKVEKFRVSNEALTKENYSLKRKIKKLEEEQEEIINKTVNTIVNKVVKEITEKYEKIIEEKDQRIFKLEQRLNISSENSSLPPSQDAIWHKDTKIYDTRSQKETTKKKGGQPGHKKHTLQKFDADEITEEENHELASCPNCNSKDLKFIGIETHDELDFEIVIKKKRHNFYKYQCNKCKEIVMCEVPQRLWGENQYGSNVQTLGLALVNLGDVSYKRTRDLIKGLTNGEIDPSEGYLTKLSKRASKALKDFVFDVEEKIVKSPIIQHDDGVIKIGKTDKDKEDELNQLINKNEKDLTEEDIKTLNDEIKKNFKGVIRAYTNKELKLYKAHTDKSADTYKEDNILNRLDENAVVVHDHMKYNYNDLFKFKNAECNIHAIRKGRSVKVNTNHEWPDKISDLLEDYNDRRDKLIKKQINHFEKTELDYLNNEYDKIIEDGILEANTFVHKNVYTDEINLLNFFKEYKQEILLWSIDFSVPFTNNLCETMIRLVKSKMKISYCFKNIESAQYYADIITYTESCFNFGINRYSALKRLFDDNPYTVEELYKIKKAQEDKKNTTQITQESEK